MYWSRRTLIMIMVIGLGLIALGCGGKDGATESSAADSSSLADVEGSMETDAENFGEGDNKAEEPKKKKKERATTVQASRAIQADLVQPVIAEGTIRARHTCEVRTEIAGKIERVYAQEGQSVRKGQLIAKLDSREYEVAAEEARAGYLQALSVLAIEEDDYDAQEISQAMRDEFSDLEKMERQGKISHDERLAREVDLDIKALKEGKFKLEIAAARSGVSVARTKLERSKLDLERTEIRAPFAGVITGLTHSAGQQVTVNETLCEVVDNLNLEADVGVLEADLGNVAVGKPTLLVVPALRETLRVDVGVVSPQFDRESRTCEVLLRVSNEQGRLRPGMFVRAIIAGKTYKDRLLVPREAILTRDNRPLLFKVEDNRAKWLYVDLGESNDDLIEITKVTQGGTLEPGDKVVVSDHLTLTHDAKIKVKKTLPTSDPWITFRREEE